MASVHPKLDEKRYVVAFFSSEENRMRLETHDATDEADLIYNMWIGKTICCDSCDYYYIFNAIWPDFVQYIKPFTMEIINHVLDNLDNTHFEDLLDDLCLSQEDFNDEDLVFSELTRCLPSKDYFFLDAFVDINEFLLLESYLSKSNILKWFYNNCYHSNKDSYYMYDGHVMFVMDFIEIK